MTSLGSAAGIGDIEGQQTQPGHGDRGNLPPPLAQEKGLPNWCSAVAGVVDPHPETGLRDACYAKSGAVNGIRTRDPKNHNLVL